MKKKKKMGRTYKPRVGKVTKKQFLDAYEEAGGDLRLVKDKLDVAQGTVRKYYKEFVLFEQKDESINHRDVMALASGLKSLADRFEVIENGGDDSSSIKDLVAAEVLKATLPEYKPEFIVHDKQAKKRRKVKGILPKAFPRILALASARRNVLLVGPAGCGKTHIARVLSKALKLPFYSISVSAGMSESQLAGWLVPTGKSGRFEYRRAPFIEAYEEGGVFLLDELDAGDANCLTFINAALADGHCPVPNRSENPVAEKHPDFICIAAANTYGHGADRMYVGRNQLDAATLDRFKIGIVNMQYDEVVEQAIVRPDILTWGRSVREVVERVKMRRIVSTRFLKDLSLMAEAAPDLFGEEKNWASVLTEDWSVDEKSRLSTGGYDG